MRLLALVEARDHVCFRYRIQAFELALERAGGSLVQEPLEPGAFGRWSQLRRAREFDAVILQRKLLPAWQLRLLRQNTKRLIFDYDDAVLFRDSYSRKGPHSRRRADRFARTVAAADVVIAGNGFLKTCALQRGARPDRVRIIPTCIDLDQYPTVWDGGGPSVSPLVWIGSSSTLKGIENNWFIWNCLGTELPGLKMRVICDRFPKLEGLPVVDVPWKQETEACELASGGIGVGLIPHDEWSQGKCGLKILQYQAAGLPVVANPWGAHREMVRPGIDGFLAGTPHEWVAAVRRLVEDDGLRRAMGAAGRKRVEEEYSTRVWADAFVGAVIGDQSDSGAVLPSAGRGPTRLGKLATSSK